MLLHFCLQRPNRVRIITKNMQKLHTAHVILHLYATNVFLIIISVSCVWTNIGSIMH